MDKQELRTFETGERVSEFSHAHPSADANYAPVLDQLDAELAKMRELAKQQQGGYLVSASSSARRRALRRRVHHELLRHLVSVALTAAKAEPRLAERFRVPNINAPNEVYLTFARKMLEQGQADSELLAKHGLTESLLADLKKTLDEYDASLTETNQGRRGHVTARAEMRAARDEIIRLVGLLDGLNRYRFGGDPAMMAAWTSAKRVVASAGKPPVGEAGEGQVKPAA